jgi:hypothetical protein
VGVATNAISRSLFTFIPIQIESKKRCDLFSQTTHSVVPFFLHRSCVPNVSLILEKRCVVCLFLRLLVNTRILILELVVGLRYECFKEAFAGGNGGGAWGNFISQ